MRLIKPTNDNRLLIVETVDYDRLTKFKWTMGKNGFTFRHERSNEILPRSGNIRYKIISIANEIFQTRNIKYDHIDLNPLNNLRNNLRIATQSQNQANKRKQKNTTSVYKGVAWFKLYSKWRAQIKKDGKVKHLGYYDDEILAAIAYDDAALRLHGEFAQLNFPLVIY